MVIKIGSNIASIQAQRRLGETTSAVSKVFEKLSSGKRINRAADDAAGLSVSEQLNANARVLSQAVRNVNDGFSYTNIADNSLEQLSTILTRQQELAEQAANGSYSSNQRQALNQEFEALTNEYNRIIATTKFNNRTIFDPENSSVVIQAGIGTDASLSVEIGNDLLSTISVIDENSPGTNETAELTIQWPTTFGGEVLTSLVDFQDASLIAQNSAVSFTYSGGTYNFWFNIDGAGSNPGLPGFAFEIAINSSDSAAQVSSAVFAVLQTPFQYQNGAQIGTSQDCLVTGITGSGITQTNFVDQTININSTSIILGSISGSSILTDYTYALRNLIDQVEGVSATTDGSTVSISYDQVGDQTDISYSSGFALTINQGTNPDLINSESFYIDILDISTQNLARSTLTSVQSQLEKVISERGSIGSAQGRLAVALAGVASTRDEYIKASSRITDADMASESAESVRLSILQQAAISVLAQANSQPSLAIQLLN